MHSLEGKVALVTGATAGIGRATAVAMAAAGARVVATGRRAGEGAETVARIEAAGGEAIFVEGDITKDADVANVVKTAVDHYGGLHVAVNNAGIDVSVGIGEATREDWDELVAVNLRGTWSCLKHELAHMRANGGGAIVNVSSVSGAVPTDQQAIYGMTKMGITHLTQAAAREAGKDDVRVNEIQPALLMSEMVKGFFDQPDAVPLSSVVERLALPRAGTVEDGANAIVFLCSDEASYITGASLPVDGGFLLYNAGSH